MDYRRDGSLPVLHIIMAKPVPLPPPPTLIGGDASPCFIIPPIPLISESLAHDPGAPPDTPVFTCKPAPPLVIRRGMYSPDDNALGISKLPGEEET